VLEVIRTVEAVTGRPVPHEMAPRRPGDPPELWADARLAHQVLGWSPAHPRLSQMVETAWAWQQRQKR